MRKCITAAVFALCTALGAPEAGAQLDLSAGESLQDLPARLVAEGWREVAPGFLQRQLPGQPTETLAFANEGLQQAVQQLRSRHGALLQTYQQKPTPEMAQALADLSAQIVEMERTLVRGQVEGLPMVTNCDIAFGCNAAAYPLTTGSRGVGANSSSYFFNNCSYQATAYADSYGYTASGSSFQSNSQNGANVSKSASISVGGGPSCFSDAVSYVSSPGLSLYYSCYQSNSSCPLIPPGVSISGPGALYISGYACQTAYWYANASGGTPPYSYSWTVYGYGAGTGSSTSMTFCGSGSTYTDYVPVAVDLYDSASGYASNSFSTTIYYSGGGGGCYEYGAEDGAKMRPIEPCY